MKNIFIILLILSSCNTSQNQFDKKDMNLDNWWKSQNPDAHYTIYDCVLEIEVPDTFRPDEYYNTSNILREEFRIIGFDYITDFAYKNKRYSLIKSDCKKLQSNFSTISSNIFEKTKIKLNKPSTTESKELIEFMRISG